MSRFVAQTKTENVNIAFGFVDVLGYFYELLQKPEDPSQESKVLKRVFSVDGISNSDIAKTIESEMTIEEANKHQHLIARICMDMQI